LKRGYSIDEIAEATLQADKARQELSASISGQKWDKVNALSERFGRVLFLGRNIGGAGGPKKNTTAAVTA